MNKEQPQFKLYELVDCARRELALRKRVYPRWVFQERMSQATATREVLLMRAILENLESQVEPKIF